MTVEIDLLDLHPAAVNDIGCEFQHSMAERFSFLPHRNALEYELDNLVSRARNVYPILCIILLELGYVIFTVRMGSLALLIGENVELIL